MKTPQLSFSRIVRESGTTLVVTMGLYLVPGCTVALLSTANYRHREMKYVSLILSEDAAHECVHGLGESGALQFTDLNLEQTPFPRRYVNYVKR